MTSNHPIKLKINEKQPNPFRIRIGNLVAYRHEKQLHFLQSQMKKEKSINQRWIKTSTKTGLELIGKHVRFYPSLLHLHTSNTVATTATTTATSYCTKLRSYKNTLHYLKSKVPDSSQWLCGEIISILGYTKSELSGIIVEILLDMNINDKPQTPLSSSSSSSSNKYKLYEFIIRGPNKFKIQTILPSNPKYKWEILSTFMTKSTKRSLLSLSSSSSSSSLPIQNVIIDPNHYPTSQQQQQQQQQIIHYEPFSFLLGEVLSMKTNVEKNKSLAMVTIKPIYIPEYTNQNKQIKSSMFELFDNYDNPLLTYFIPIENLITIGRSITRVRFRVQVGVKPFQPFTFYIQNMYSKKLNQIIQTNTKNTKKRNLLSNQNKKTSQNKRHKPLSVLKKTINLCSRFQIYNRTNKSIGIKPSLNISNLRGSKSPRSQLRRNIQIPTNTSRSSRANQRRLIKHTTGSIWNTYEFNMYQISKREPKLRFGRSSIHQWGVFADESIRKNDMILEYRGELIGNAIADKREKEYENTIGSDYMFRIDAYTVCDATKTGSLARYINASCNPNCKTQINIIHGIKKIFIYAKTNISQGQELSYDYKFPMEYDPTKRIPCHCKAKNCRGYMNWVSLTTLDFIFISFISSHLISYSYMQIFI